MRTAEADLEASRAIASELDGARRQAAEREIEARTALDHLTARVNSLRGVLVARGELQPNHTSNGVDLRLRTILESLNGDRPAVDPSILKHVMRAPLALEPALKAVLGPQLDAVIVESPQFALRAIEILKENRAGRMDFVQEPDAAVTPHQSIDAPGIAGRLVEMLDVESRFSPVAEAMLGHVMLADDLHSALAASNLNGHGTVFVTRDGDLVMPGRMISGGSAEDNHAAVDLAAIEAETRELERAEEEHRTRVAAFASVRAEREDADAALESGRSRAREAERIANEHRGALARAEQSVALAEAHGGNSRRRLSELADLVVTSNARLEELAKIEQEARARLTVMATEIASLRATAEEIGAVMLEAASKVEARKSRLAALESELAHARREADALEAQIDEHRATLERSHIERADFERELETLSAQDVAARARETELEAELARLRTQCDASERELEARRADYKNAQESLTALEAEATDCGLKRERARALSEELARAFIEKFGAEFDAMAAEIVPALDGRIPAEDDARIVELRAKMERIGEVNLAADSEVKELEERAGVLGTERADLQSALDDLDEDNHASQSRGAQTLRRNFRRRREKLRRAVPQAAARRQGPPRIDRRRRRARSGRQRPRAAARQEGQGDRPAVRRRESALRDGADLLAVPAQPEPVLRDGRSRRAARRVQPRRVHDADVRAEDALAVHRDHAQPAHDAARRPDSRRHNGPPGSLANHLTKNPASRVGQHKRNVQADITRTNNRAFRRSRLSSRRSVSV